MSGALSLGGSAKARGQRVPESGKTVRRTVVPYSTLMALIALAQLNGDGQVLAAVFAVGFGLMVIHSIRVRVYVTPTELVFWEWYRTYRIDAKRVRSITLADYSGGLSDHLLPFDYRMLQLTFVDGTRRYFPGTVAPFKRAARQLAYIEERVDLAAE